MTAQTRGGNALLLLDKLVDQNPDSREVFILLRAYMMPRPAAEAVDPERFAAVMSFVTRFLVLQPGAVDLFVKQLDQVATQMLGAPQSTGQPS
jgi:hypothetical protein